LGGTSSFRQDNVGTWTGDAGASEGKLEYHSNRWYINAGSSSSEVVRFRRGGTDVAWIDNNGALSCTNDITAFASDERLKTNIKPLENALNKVLSLNGFTYNFNEIGKSLGFDSNVDYVGVSAQQVQAVLPEAVKPAPVNSDYITVQYEKIVPLLIEAIKELKQEINSLKNK
jgi:hypothetical protein